MHRGYWRVWRKWDGHPVSGDPKAWLVFCHLINNAAFAPQRKAGYDLDVGESDLTREQLCLRTGMSEKEVRNSLLRLVRMECISTRYVSGSGKGRKRAIQKVCNYAAYNASSDNDGPSEGPSMGQLGAAEGPVLKNGEEAKNGKLSTKPKRKRTANAETQDFIDWYSQYPGIEPKRAEAWKHWQAMSETEREKAIEVLPAYIRSKANADIRYTVRAHNYLKERMFNNPIVTANPPKVLGGNPIGGAASW